MRFISLLAGASNENETLPSYGEEKQRMRCKRRIAWRNNWVVVSQWDINTPLGSSYCLTISFFINWVIQDTPYYHVIQG